VHYSVCVLLSGDSKTSVNYYIDSTKFRKDDKDRQVHITDCNLGAKFAIVNCLVIIVIYL